MTIEENKHRRLLAIINERTGMESWSGNLYFVYLESRTTKLLVTGSCGNDAQDIESLCFCHDDLYFNSSHYIDSLLHGRRIAFRKDGFAFVCEHKGELYDYSENKVIKTLTGEIVADYASEIEKLCSTEESLFALTNGDVVDVFKGTKIRVGGCVHNLFSTGGQIFSVKIGEDGISRIFDTKQGRLIARRGGFIRDIFMHNGTLYDTSSYWCRNHVSLTAMEQHRKVIGLYETLSERRIPLLREISEDINYSIDSLCDYNGKLIGIDACGNLLDILNNMHILSPSESFAAKNASTEYIDGPNLIRSVNAKEYAVIEEYSRTRKDEEDAK
ncbi:MAG: hypothetical protein KJ574_01965 [Nanoarchaeota archaeon]|nr:hypothetical protein [Nanoarchaeota archaeon]